MVMFPRENVLKYDNKNTCGRAGDEAPSIKNWQKDWTDYTAPDILIF